MRRSCFLLAVLCLTFGAASAQVVLVEAESFADLGGWVVDQQFMDEMGSPFVLAHGLGVPVKDATTSVDVPAAGPYRVWVRTRDWVAPWKAAGSPGKFQLLVEGKPLEATFGTQGAAWAWQDGGTVRVEGRKVSLALHDLTGFEGRCDAIILSGDPDFKPADDYKALAAWREKTGGASLEPGDGGSYDLVVVGGGIAGTAAALSAGRLGLSVALIQDRPVLGGNNSSEVRVWLGGNTNYKPYPRVGDVVRELDQKRRGHYGAENKGEYYEDTRKADLVKAEKTITLMLNHRAIRVEMKDGKVAAVIAQHIVTGKRVRVGCTLAADCTGDGVIGALAGADWDMTPKGRMGKCNLWNTVDTGQPQAFPRVPWALDLASKPFPGRGPEGDKELHKLGVWYWESGFDRDPFTEGEYVRDGNFRAMYGAWDALKNVDKKYANHKLNWAAYVCGPRESRRLLGDVILTKEDVLGNKSWDDACVPCTWMIDLHLPDPHYVKGFEEDPFISVAHYTKFKPPYWLPYRCLYSRNVPNLFMAGRDISVTHEALGTVRVMRTCGMMGEIVGMAAAVAKKHGALPRSVYAQHLAELKELMTKGVGKLPPVEAPPDFAVKAEPPAWLKSAGANLAPNAKVAASSSHDSGKYKAEFINDGDAAMNNAKRWVSGASGPHKVELTWEQPQTFSALRIVTGWDQGGTITGMLDTFTLEYDDNGQWKEIPGGKISANAKPDWSLRFPAVTTARLRLTIESERVPVARIWELEVYNLKN